MRSSTWTPGAPGTPRATPPSTAPRRRRTCATSSSGPGRTHGAPARSACPESPTWPSSSGAPQPSILHTSRRSIRGKVSATAIARWRTTAGSQKTDSVRCGGRDASRTRISGLRTPSRCTPSIPCGMHMESKTADLSRVEVPAYVVASWSDQGLHTRGTLEGFKQHPKQAQVAHDSRPQEVAVLLRTRERRAAEALLRSFPEGDRERGRLVAAGAPGGAKTVL